MLHPQMMGHAQSSLALRLHRARGSQRPATQHLRVAQAQTKARMSMMAAQLRGHLLSLRLRLRLLLRLLLHRRYYWLQPRQQLRLLLRLHQPRLQLRETVARHASAGRPQLLAAE